MGRGGRGRTELLPSRSPSGLGHRGFGGEEPLLLPANGPHAGCVDPAAGRDSCLWSVPNPTASAAQGGGSGFLSRRRTASNRGDKTDGSPANRKNSAAGGARWGATETGMRCGSFSELPAPGVTPLEGGRRPGGCREEKPVLVLAAARGHRDLKEKQPPGDRCSFSPWRAYPGSSRSGPPGRETSGSQLDSH